MIELLVGLAVLVVVFAVTYVFHRFSYGRRFGDDSVRWEWAHTATVFWILIILVIFALTIGKLILHGGC